MVDADPVRILALGDPTQDQLLLPLPPKAEQGAFDWQRYPQYVLWELEGGVCLGNTVLEDFGFSPEVVPVNDPQHVLKSLVRLRPVKESAKGRLEFSKTPERSGAKVPYPFRIDRFEGYFPAPRTETCDVLPGSSGSYPYVLVNDAGGATRCLGGGDAAKLAVAIAPDTLVLHKMHLPLDLETPLAELLRTASSRSTILVVTAEDLRASGVRLRGALSWDMALEDLWAALRCDGFLVRAKRHYAAIAILFREDGAFVLTSVDGTDSLGVAVDAQSAEGDFGDRHAGDVYGKTNVFASALLARLHHAGRAVPDAGDLARALATTRAYAAGYITVNELDGSVMPLLPQVDPHIIWAEQEPADLLTRQIGAFSDRAVALMGDVDGPEVLAEKIVKTGAKALRALPSARFGKFQTIDRVEIEGFRTIRSLIGSYLADDSRNKPLSIAVFGPPGSGKSFGIKEMVSDRNVVIREYNLSEAASEALPGYFHELRDIALTGRTPLCFFDEFDSRNCELVARFLAPMQDGTFRDGARVHPVGRAILVFAGGTAKSAAEFAGTGVTDPQEVQRRQAAKLPDFISRLGGVIDIRGINPAGGDDRHHLLRLAILLRVLLERDARHIIDGKTGEMNIQPQVLKALLTASDYRFGARSMEKILLGSALAQGRPVFGVSDLPGQALLELHLEDPAAFNEIAHSADSRVTCG
jgi:hypothetical protein